MATACPRIRGDAPCRRSNEAQSAGWAALWPHGCDDIVVLGRPAEMIGSIARDRGMQLIVMGLASDRGIFAARPGSIAYRVLCSTTVPVLVVPTSDK